MQQELQISPRGIEMPESPIRKLAPLVYKAEDEGVKIYRLNIGQPDLPTPQKALDALKEIDRSTLEYSLVRVLSFKLLIWLQEVAVLA